MSVLNKNIKESTKKLYKDNLNYLIKKEINYKRIDNVDEFVNKIKNITTLKNDKISNGTVKKYLIAVINYHKNKQRYNKKLIADINIYVKSISQENISFRKSGDLSKKEEHDFIDWEIVLNVYKDLYNKRLNTSNDYVNFFILSLYVEFPPRRLKDYAKMIYIKNDENINVDKNYCYYDDKNNKMQFIFLNHKTSQIKKNTDLIPKNQSKIRYDISENQQKIILEYLHKFNIVENKYLIDLSDFQIRNKLNGNFENLNKKISVNILRHSYISFLFKNKYLVLSKNRKFIALCMGHNELEQELYIKSIEKNVKNINYNNFREINNLILDD